MTQGNFDWCLHALLFLHTERVIKAQMEKRQRLQDNEEEDEGEGEGEDEGLMLTKSEDMNV